MKEQHISSNNMKSFFEIWIAPRAPGPFLGFVGHSNNFVGSTNYSTDFYDS